MDLIGAVDVGGTKIAVGVVNPQGEVLAMRSFPSRPMQAFQSVMLEIAGHLEGMLVGLDGSLVGIGIGSTGQVDPLVGVVLNNSFLPSWSGQNPVVWLTTHFGVPSALENDADAAALAEWGLGNGRLASRMIYVTVSTGIGAGMIFDGQVYRGAAGIHPEVGHHTIDPSGPACFCGNHGCWEVLASGQALARRMREKDHNFSGDAVQVCDLAESGNPLASSATAEHAAALGIGLANLIILYAPDIIVMGGGLIRRSELFLPLAYNTILERCYLVPPKNTNLVLSALGPDTALIGASRVWVYHFPHGNREK